MSISWPYHDHVTFISRSHHNHIMIISLPYHDYKAQIVCAYVCMCSHTYIYTYIYIYWNVYVPIIASPFSLPQFSQFHCLPFFLFVNLHTHTHTHAPHSFWMYIDTLHYQGITEWKVTYSHTSQEKFALVWHVSWAMTWLCAITLESLCSMQGLLCMLSSPWSSLETHPIPMEP